MTTLSTFSGCMSIVTSFINPVVAAPPAYPFVGVKAVKAELERNPEIQKAVVCMLWHLQTETEQAKRDTEVRNKAGFMSSDAWHGSRIAERLANGMELTGEDEAKIAAIACKYSKQLSIQLRRQAMVENPALAAYAVVFSAQ